MPRLSKKLISVQRGESSIQWVDVLLNNGKAMFHVEFVHGVHPIAPEALITS